MSGYLIVIIAIAYMGAGFIVGRFFYGRERIRWEKKVKNTYDTMPPASIFVLLSFVWPLSSIVFGLIDIFSVWTRRVEDYGDKQAEKVKAFRELSK